MMLETNWTLWRSFLAVYETGSLSNAARQLRMSQPTIGRHIKELECTLERPLFLRSQMGLQPTQLADSMAPTAQVMANAATTLARQATANENAGTVRLSASEIVGVEVLPPVLTGFRAIYPSIAIELVVSNEQDDLLTRSADIAIRMTPPTQERLIRKRIGSAGISLYALKTYLMAHGRPKMVDDLHMHQLIGMDRNRQQLQNYPLIDGLIASTEFSFRSDSDLAQLAAVRAGLGIGVCQDVIARRTPDLEPVLSSDISFELPVWLAKHEDMKNDPIVDVTFKFLAHALTNVYRT